MRMPFWPERRTDRRKILEGVRFLRDQGLVLPGQNLAKEHIVITQEGQVKICESTEREIPFPVYAN